MMPWEKGDPGMFQSIIITCTPTCRAVQKLGKRGSGTERTNEHTFLSFMETIYNELQRNVIRALWKALGKAGGRKSCSHTLNAAVERGRMG